MKHPYFKVTQKAKELLYPFMKLNDMKASSYTYHSFFESQISSNNILVIGHDLRNTISGFSIIDNQGIYLITYDSSHHQHRQNFTKCHELGHYLLNHDGKVFTDNNENNLQEIEADYFSSFILMPDIILLGNILHENKSFQDIFHSLDVSPSALFRRLNDILSFNTNLNATEINSIIWDYQSNRDRNDIQSIFNSLKDGIIKDYRQAKLSPFDKLQQLLTNKNFITHQSLPELKDQSFCQKVRRIFPNIKTWSKYERGKTLWYAWNSKKMTEKEVQRAVNFALYDLQNKND
ncbi:ImmA/IrrE family metallo-endopeptidase [Streptococcus sanguinis]|jgi:Zn-dependent peptidase ImmA (M78 family)|uniref:ImmA/IrrE family metallo-endopeptidase n=1 Tax=Streptococcus sanguinis TaxID=1305 RepID=UPI0022E7282F|nr:ImmA/IrrE family metallo-endopeptidase [Streptococcus sanguinis]